MACERVPSLTFAFPIIAGAVVTIDEAEAAAADAAFSATAAPCYYDPAPTGGAGDVGGIGYYCYGVESLDGLEARNADQIPIDGVLVLQAQFHGTWAQTIADRATVTVTLDDVPVAGALELTPAPGLLVWRPSAAWTEGATYHFNAAISNPGIPLECGMEVLAVDFDMTVGAAPSAELTPSTLTGTETINEVPILGLGSLVCCPGFAPTLYLDQCGGSETVQFDPAQCAPTQAEGTLLVDMTGTESATGATALQLYYELTIDGASYAIGLTPIFSVALQKPFCATVTTHDVASGDSVTGPIKCFGDDAAGALGTHAIAPPESFTCSLRTCEIDGNTWDLDACTPLDPNHPNEPEPDTGKGCDCTADDANAPAALVLAGVLGLLLRRRRSRQ